MKKHLIWLFVTAQLAIMSCGAGCSTVTSDTEARTALEIQQCRQAVRAVHAAAVEFQCGEMSAAECPFTDTLRAGLAAAEQLCENP